MFPRIVLLTTLLLFLAVLPGCPGAPSALLGSWVITELGGSKYGFQLNEDGTVTPFMVDTILDGTFTWEVNGTRVLIHQVGAANNQIVYAALQVSDTTLSGAWVVWNGIAYGDSNTFSAAKQ